MSGELSEATEQLRRRFRPVKIRVLFIGESAPAGGTFFYAGNSSAHNYMRAAFAKFDPSFGTNFLNKFKEVGCFLDDLVMYPINEKPPREKREAYKAGIPALAHRMAEAEPKSIVVFKSSIEESVREALSQSNNTARFYCTPFPGNGHQNKFLERMTTLLPELLS